MTSGPSSFLREPVRLGPRTRHGLRYLNLPQRLLQWLLSADFDQVADGDSENGRQFVQCLEPRITLSALKLGQQTRRNHVRRHINLREAAHPSGFSDIGADLAAKSTEIHRISGPDVVPELYTTIGMILIDRTG